MNEKWDKLKNPPQWALKRIKGGRLSGMTDISPMWRIEAMTEVYGPCGLGWCWSIEKLWIDEGHGGEQVAHAIVKLTVIDGESVSEPIYGVGGSRFVTKERGGMYTNDEAYKMAVTDALSTAMKCLGVGAEVYKGKGGDTTKYTKSSNTPEIKKPTNAEAQRNIVEMYKKKCAEKKMTPEMVTDFENAICNAKKNENFGEIMPDVISNFDATYNWWHKKYMEEEAKKVFGGETVEDDGSNY